MFFIFLISFYHKILESIKASSIHTWNLINKNYELKNNVSTKNNTYVQEWISTYTSEGLDTNKKENGDDEERK